MVEFYNSGIDFKKLDDAFKGTIEEWRGIVSLKRKNKGSVNLPLCLLFYSGHGVECASGCPIFEKTGQVGCIGTPYMFWWKYQRVTGHNRNRGMFVFNDMSQELAGDELKFLEDLYDEWKEKVGICLEDSDG